MSGLETLRLHAEDLRAIGDDYSVPLGAVQVDGAPRLIGTGSFFRCGEAWFLVSAEHVLRDLRFPGAGPERPNDCDLLVPGRGNATVRLSGRMTASGKYDVAILRLDDPNEVIGRWTPVTVADLAPEDDPTDSWYHITGWPSQLWAQRAPLRFTAPFDAGEVEHKAAGEILIRLDVNDFGTFDGQPSTPPDLHGISGAPVWRVFRGNHARLEPRFAGIETGYIRRGPNLFIKATRWGAIRRLVEHSEPGLFKTAERLVLR